MEIKKQIDSKSKMLLQSSDFESLDGFLADDEQRVQDALLMMHPGCVRLGAVDFRDTIPRIFSYLCCGALV